MGVVVLLDQLEITFQSIPHPRWEIIRVPIMQ